MFDFKLQALQLVEVRKTAIQYFESHSQLREENLVNYITDALESHGLLQLSEHIVLLSAPCEVLRDHGSCSREGETCLCLAQGYVEL